MLNFYIELLFFIEILTFIISIWALFINFKLYFNFNFNSFSETQFKLEQQSYLQKTIIYLTLLSSLALIIFFIFALDSLSFKIKGAMCASGIINSNDFGNLTLIAKLISFFLLSFWISIDYFEKEHKYYPYIKIKIYTFFLLFIFLILEKFFLINFFLELFDTSIVKCCSVIYSNSGTNLFLGVDFKIWFIIFIISFLSSCLKNSYITLVFETLFLISSLILITNFFSSYIYELPTHKCPYCMLKHEYSYIGYFIFLTLFTSSIFNFIYAILGMFALKDEKLSKIKRVSIFFKILFVLLVIYFPISYYIKNGVWL
ncbi:MAG: hypothetical protein HXX81_07645 [Campylobacterales bacterium]|nr:hypothetical protein [Campylobacterales bacterium]